MKKIDINNSVDIKDLDIQTIYTILNYQEEDKIKIEYYYNSMELLKIEIFNLLSEIIISNRNMLNISNVVYNHRFFKILKNDSKEKIIYIIENYINKEKIIYGTTSTYLAYYVSKVTSTESFRKVIKELENIGLNYFNKSTIKDNLIFNENEKYFIKYIQMRTDLIKSINANEITTNLILIDCCLINKYKLLYFNQIVGDRQITDIMQLDNLIKNIMKNDTSIIYYLTYIILNYYQGDDDFNINNLIKIYLKDISGGYLC